MIKPRNFLNRLVVVGSLVVACAAIFGVTAGAKGVYASACPGKDDDNNAVIRCGFNTPNELASKVSASSELQTLYNHAFTDGYGIGNLDNFKKNAKHATIYRDGNVVLDDGTIIGTNANTLGRQSWNKPGRHPVTIGGNTYFWSAPQVSFASGTNSLSVFVLVNQDDHSLKFAAMPACGNPTWANSPAYKCDMLTKTQPNSNDNTTYDFVAKPFVKNGAAVAKIVYDFGDGSSKTVDSNFGQSVRHSYASGDFTARATVFFKVNGQTRSDTRVECTKPVHVEKKIPPVFVCKALNFITISKEDRTYKFNVVSAQSGGPKLASADFDLGDGQKSVGVISSDGQTATVTHTYAKTLTGDITITAAVHSDTGVTDAGNSKCATKINLESQPVISFICKVVTVATISQSDREYRFTLTSDQAGGPKLASANFDFGDNQTAIGVIATDDHTASVTHKYDKSLVGDITIIGNAVSDTGKVTASNACVAKLNFEQPPTTPKECKPGIPEGDVRCQPVTPPAQPPQPPVVQTVQSLPSTGPVEVTGGIIGASSLAGAGMYYRKSRNGMRDYLRKFIR